MADFSELAAALTELRTVREAVEAFIDGVDTKLNEAVAAAVAANDASDLTAITDFAAGFRAEKDALAGAITANTPAEEPPPA